MVSSGKRFALWLTIGVDVDFAVHVVRASVGGILAGWHVFCTSGDVGEDPDERRSRIGHVGIEAALFFPKLADPGALFGFEAGHDLVDVRLVAASVVAFG